jgi:cytochrome oxidase Cu insertion factor (SCO1/SenC/PrrC family)
MSGPDGRAAVRTLWPRLSVYKHVSATARRLLEASFLHEDSAVSCCACSKAAKVAEPQPIAQSIAALHDIELENQDGMRASFGKTFRGRTSLIAFFYTRCMNPDKCSRTVSKLARVHNLLDHKLPQSSAMVAGITYDPEYDSAARLRSYGIDRGMSFDERCQLLRSTGSFADVRDALGLGVGYGSSTVNRHRIELLVVDPSGKILDSNLRRLWDEHEVADRLVAIETADTTRAA